MQSLAALVMACATVAAGVEFHYKQISGDPSEFQHHRYPNASTFGQASDVTMVPIAFTGTVWTRGLTIDSTNFSVAVLTPSGASVSISMKDTNNQPIDLTKIDHVSVNVPVSDNDDAATGTQYKFVNQRLGTYTVSVSPVMETFAAVRGQKAKLNQTFGTEDAIFVLWNDSPDTLLVHPLTQHTVLGGKIGAVATMFDETVSSMDSYRATGVKPTALRDVVRQAIMTVTTPSGEKLDIPMQDNGIDGDLVANDGEYTGDIIASELGMYRMHVSIAGVNAAGVAFSRTQDVDTMVVNQMIDFKPFAFAMANQNTQRVQLFLPVTPSSSMDLTTTLRTYAEIYGENNQGDVVAVTFSECLGELQVVKSALGQITLLKLDVDLRWFAKANVRRGIQIRNVLVENINKLVPLDFVESINVVHALGFDSLSADESSVAAEKLFASSVDDIIKSGYSGDVTTVMKEGIRTLQLPPKNESADIPSLVLVHGFCADRNPFEVQASDWTNVAFYSANREGNPLARENDDFAKDILTYISTLNDGKGLPSFGMVGQSQGGMAILHILNYYQSGLDMATGGLKIQSIATPYLGNTALSSLGGIAGVLAPGCSPPKSLDSKSDGAPAWLSGISVDNIQQVNAYYTQYKKEGLFGDGWCNSFMNVFLRKPNDGVCEVELADPGNGATIMPMKEGWCHADEMNYPPSFWDSDRNKIMDAAAAR